MIKDIVTDLDLLSIKSNYCTFTDSKAIQLDLIDTVNNFNFKWNYLTANQIGKNKRVILIRDYNDINTFLINPILLKKCNGKKISSESCVSLPNIKVDVERYRHIILEYVSRKAKVKVRKFMGKKAKAVQHALDHLDGLLITHNCYYEFLNLSFIFNNGKRGTIVSETKDTVVVLNNLEKITLLKENIIKYNSDVYEVY